MLLELVERYIEEEGLDVTAETLMSDRNMILLDNSIWGLSTEEEMYQAVKEFFQINEGVGLNG